MDNDEANREFEAITAGFGKSRWQRLMDPTDPFSVEDLDDEELYRGQCKDRNGRFTGGKPDAVPRDMVLEWGRRIRQGAQNRLDSKLLTMVDALVEMIESPETDSQTRLAALKYGMDRVLGKATDRVEVAVSQKPYEALFVDGGIFRRIEDEPPTPAVAEIEGGTE